MLLDSPSGPTPVTHNKRFAIANISIEQLFEQNPSPYKARLEEKR